MTRSPMTQSCTNNQMKAYCENKQNMWITVMLLPFMVRLMPCALVSELSILKHEMGPSVCFRKFITKK